MQRSNETKTCLLYIAQTHVKCGGRGVHWKSCEWLDARQAELSLALKEWCINGLHVSTTIMLAPLLFAHSSAACNSAIYTRVINSESRAKILQTSNKAKIWDKKRTCTRRAPTRWWREFGSTDLRVWGLTCRFEARKSPANRCIEKVWNEGGGASESEAPRLTAQQPDSREFSESKASIVRVNKRGRNLRCQIHLALRQQTKCDQQEVPLRWYCYSSQFCCWHFEVPSS